LLDSLEARARQFYGRDLPQPYRFSQLDKCSLFSVSHCSDIIVEPEPCTPG
jgi:hypothetical protein